MFSYDNKEALLQGGSRKTVLMGLDNSCIYNGVAIIMQLVQEIGSQMNAFLEGKSSPRRLI